MAKITAEIKANTTELKIKITYSSNPAPVLAVYEYQLKESDSNPPVETHSGDNQNSQDDIYLLPTPSQINKKRYALIKSNVAAIDKDADFTIKIEVIQNDITTDTLLSNGKVLANGEGVLKIDMIKFI